MRSGWEGRERSGEEGRELSGEEGRKLSGKEGRVGWTRGRETEEGRGKEKEREYKRRERMGEPRGDRIWGKKKGKCAIDKTCPYILKGYLLFTSS